MEEISLNNQQQQQQQQNNGGVGAQVVVGQQSNNNKGPNNGQEDGSSNVKAQYSIPGILHFIQHEWARFELERSQWEVDRAELQARIAFLQGERKGQENLKNDLVRRIKMLEFALKQERGKFHKLKYGTDLQTPNEMKTSGAPIDESADGQMDVDRSYVAVSNSTWKQGRQLLRQYLQEIGYTDRIIDVRSTRVRALLGLNNNTEQEENVTNTGTGGQQQQQGGGGGGLNNGSNESNKRASENQGRRTPAKKTQPSSLAEAIMLDTEAAVMANLEFLGHGDVDMDDDDDDDMNDDGDLEQSDDIDDVKLLKRKGKLENLGDDVDAEAMEVLNELNLLSEVGDRQDYKNENFQSGGPKRPLTGLSGTANEDDNLDSGLGLGELAQLTVNNDAESSYDIASSKEAFRKTWNAKYTLRSHFDGVRSLSFHPSEPVLITASEDHTLKLWNLQKTVPAKKSASLDVEPLYTFRSHTGPVLCVVVSGTGEHCYSGGLDGAINCWNIPNSSIDPYDLFEPEVLECTLQGHTDAVWGLSVLQSRQHLVSCSADGTVKLWSPHVKGQLLNTFQLGESKTTTAPTPSSVDFVRDVPDRIVVGYTGAGSSHSPCVIYDSETGKAVMKFESTPPDGSASTNDGSRQINKVVSHPSMPITITAHEDRHIRFWDNNTGKMLHMMVAHLDAVTSLAVDPNGMYILSGSHDCSIRLWHMDNKTCVQEITAHRKKFDESILDVAFHPSRPYIASAGADGLAKVFV